MFHSVLLAGIFLAAAASPVTPVVPTAAAHTLPNTAAVAVVSAVTGASAAAKPVRVASAAQASPLLQARVAWEAPASALPDALTADEQEFVEKVNAERAARGLCTLTVDPLLVRTARAHSREMCARDYFDHHSPTPGLATPMDRYLKGLHDGGGATPDSLLVGENIYYCSVFSDVYNVDYSHRALMNSPGHRANILEPRFARIGLGIYRNAAGEFWVTEMFVRDTDY